MGCRERPKGALNIAGSRPSGIYSAGTAQKYVNMKGYLPGKNIVILGSGDIGLIMARRMTLEGAKVHAVCEIMPYSGGLVRNIEQCLNDFNIPMMLKHTVVEVHGNERVEGVTIAKVDQNRRPIPETKKYISCDTLLLSVGLIPENELSKKANIEISQVTGGAVVDQNRQTSIEGIFSCGNVLHVHDLADYVSDEAAVAGNAAANYILENTQKETSITIKTDGKIKYTVPQTITQKTDITVYFRVNAPYKTVKINVLADGNLIVSKKKTKVSPGEMETLKIQEEYLENAKELSFALEEL